MKLILVVLGLVLMLSVVFLFFNKSNVNEEDVHYHAGFLVYIDGIKQDYSEAKFMHADYCKVNEDEENEDDQIEKAHLHGFIGDVVHVHRSNATWGDLIKNINVSFQNDKEIKGYVNGNEIDNILSYPIKAYDSVIIVVGNSSNINLNEYVSKEYIQKVEIESPEC